MAQPLTQSIISGSGGDFTSLASWESQNLDLVTLDSSSMAIISGSWSNYEYGTITIDGWNTNATHNITIVATGSARHSGVWNNTAYRIMGSGSNGLNINDHYVNIDGIQVSGSFGNAAFNNGILTTTFGDSIVVSNCIVYVIGTGASGAIGLGSYAVANTIYNCAVVNTSRYPHGWCSCIGSVGGGGTSKNYVSNCTVFGGQYGYREESLNLVLYNNIAQNSVDGFDGTFLTASNNYSDIAGDAPGTNAKSGSILFINSASYDFRLSPYDTTCLGKGISLYTASVPITTDIAGVSRGTSAATNFDIGAFHSTQSIQLVSETASVYNGISSSYTTLTTWETQNQNLVANNKSNVALITGSWANPETSPLAIAGWTTDASHSITVMTTGSARHNGRWSDTAHRINGGISMTIYISNVSLQGIQTLVFFNGLNAMGILTSYNDSPDNIIIDNCISKTTGSVNFVPIYNIGYGIYAPYGTTQTVRNCIAYGFLTGSTSKAGFVAYGSLITFYNCTSFGCSDGYESAGGFPVVINCLAQQCNDGFLGSWGATSKYNCSDIAGDAPGTNARSGSVLFRNSSAYDFRLSNDDTVAKGYGKDLYNSGLVIWNTDIAEVTRTSGSWDIGAFAYVPYYIPIVGFIVNPYVRRFSSNILLLPG